MARDVRSIERGRGLLSMRIEIELDNVIIRMRSKAPCSSCEGLTRPLLRNVYKAAKALADEVFYLREFFRLYIYNLPRMD